MLHYKIKKYKSFFLDVIAVFIGITFSFWVENFREDIQERKVKRDVIQELYLNLELDSIRASYVRDSLIGQMESSFIYTIDELQMGIANDEETAMMLAYWQFYNSFWQTQFAFDRLMNLSIEEILSPGILQKLDFYYQVVNELHGLRRSRTAQKEYENRMEYLTSKGIFLPAKTTFDKFKHVPVLGEEQKERLQNEVFFDPEFEALYTQRVQMIENWNLSLSYMIDEASKLRNDLFAFYDSEYGRNLNEEVKDKHINLDPESQVIKDAGNY